MTIKTIEFYNNYAKEFTLKTWGKKLNVRVHFVSTKSYYGMFRGRTDRTFNRRTPLAINLSVVTLENHEKAIDTLKHELCHWYAYTEGQPFKDGQDFFENLLKSVGASSTCTGGHKELSNIIQGSSESGRRKGSDNARFEKVEDTELSNKYKCVFFKLDSIYAVYEGSVFLGKVLRVKQGTRVGWIPDYSVGGTTYYSTRKSAFYDMFKRKCDAMQEFADAHKPR